MIKFLKTFLLISIAANWINLSGFNLHAQETLSSVQRDLDRVDKEIEHEKELHKNERKRAVEFDAEKALKLKALQEQLHLSQNKIDSLKKLLDKSKQQKVSFKSQASVFQNHQKEFVKALGKQIHELAASFKNDFPYDREKRVGDLDALAIAIESGVVGVEDGLNRFFTLMQTSLDFAFDTETYRGSYVATDGTTHEGSYVRLGAALMAFADDEGKVTAFLTKEDVTKEGAGYVWKDRDLEPKTREDILTAIKVAQGKVAPQLVSIPFKAPKLVETQK